MNRRKIILVLLICLSAMGLRVLAQNSPVVGGDDAALRAYIERFVNSTGLSQPFTVNIGALPAGLPFEIPVPPNVRVLGSITRTAEGKQAYEIAMDGSTPAEVLAFYNQAFSVNGWSVIQADDTTAGGFSTTAGTLGRYCLNGTEASILVDATSPEPGKNLVNIIVRVPVGELYECEAMLVPAGDDPYAVLAGVSLGTPDGVTIVNNTNDGLSYYHSSSNTASKGAVIRSDLPAAQIATGYNDQITKLNWTSVMSESGNNFAISTWTRTAENGKTWKLTFMLSAAQNAGVYNALLYVED